jgi:uncharacterized metal-binding protein YceD (DUF177 family)
MTVIIEYVMFCPRCNRKYLTQTSMDATLAVVKTHVARQHPDHDQEWWDTSNPEPVENVVPQ